MIDHALAAPVWCDDSLRQVANAESPGPGTGSHAHRCAPVRASNARTTPEGALARRLSATAEPTMMRSWITAGGDVTAYSPLYSGELRRPPVRSTCPLRPKSAHGRP